MRYAACIHGWTLGTEVANVRMVAIAEISCPSMGGAEVGNVRMAAIVEISWMQAAFRMCIHLPEGPSSSARFRDTAGVAMARGTPCVEAWRILETVKNTVL